MNTNKTKKASQSEQAYELLKWKILNAELSLGRLYTEAELCELVNLGRSPIRSALSNLHRDRLIEVIPRKGMFVKGWTAEELRNVTDARLTIESEVMKLAVASNNSEQINKLKTLLKEGKKHLKNNDRKELMRIDHEFHIGLAKITDNPVYVELVEFLKQRSHSLWFLTITGPEKLLQVQKEHEEILDAIIKKDKRVAVSAIKRHLSKLLDFTY